MCVSNKQKLPFPPSFPPFLPLRIKKSEGGLFISMSRDIQKLRRGGTCVFKLYFLFYPEEVLFLARPTPMRVSPLDE